MPTEKNGEWDRYFIVNDRRILEIIASPENFFKPKHGLWHSWDFFLAVYLEKIFKEHRHKNLNCLKNHISA